MNKQSLQVAFAYMSVVIGGGFASGQEVLQFFTGYGLIGVAGTLVAGLMFAFLGMQVARISSAMGAKSHKDVLYNLFGSRAGFLVDLLLSFFLFGVGVVMLAGSGSIFSQQYDWPPIVGGLFMCGLVIATLCLNVNRIVELISAVMPFLLVMVLAITTYSIFTHDAPIEILSAVAQETETVSDNWFVGAVLYASFNIAVGFPMLAVIGGMIHNPKVACRGGIAGGLGLGLLIVLLNVGLFANIDQLQGIAMPTLALAGRISPILSLAMSVALICMIYSTAVGMFFAFSTRFAKPETARFKAFSAVSVLIGLGLSFAGFSKLIGTVYPLLGYVGFAMILAIGYSWIRNRSRNNAAVSEIEPA